MKYFKPSHTIKETFIIKSYWIFLPLWARSAILGLGNSGSMRTRVRGNRWTRTALRYFAHWHELKYTFCDLYINNHEFIFAQLLFSFAGYTSEAVVIGASFCRTYVVRRTYVDGILKSYLLLQFSTDPHETCYIDTLRQNKGPLAAGILIFWFLHFLRIF